MNYANPQILLKNAIAKAGSLKAVCSLTKLKKSTLLRIQSGETTDPHPATLGKLLKVVGHE